MVKLIAQQTAANLSYTKCGRWNLSTVQVDGRKVIMLCSEWLGNKEYEADRVFIYDNNNILLHDSVHNKYRLLFPNTTSDIYDEISIDVYDDKYRKAVCYINGEKCVSLINETTGQLQFPPVRWNDIMDVHNDIAIVSLRQRGPQTLVWFQRNLSGGIKEADEYLYIGGSLYKFRTDGIRLYKLFNAHTMQSSNPKIGYTDIRYISDQLAMGIYNSQWDFINIFSMEVMHSSIREPVIENGIIHIVSCDNNEFDINLYGTEVVSVGRFIIVNDERINLSDNNSIHTTTKDIAKLCNIKKGNICWVLMRHNKIIITAKTGISRHSRRILSQEEMPEDIKSFANSLDSKWYNGDCFISAGNVTEVIKSKLQEIVEKKNAAENANPTINNTDDASKLKAIYHYLQQQGFGNQEIFDALYILFPSIERQIDSTDLRTKYADLDKKIKEYTETCNVINSNTGTLIEMLNLNDKESAIFNYYTKVKEMSIDATIKCINDESPTGTEVARKYNELMRIDEMLDDELRKLRRLIIEDLALGSN